MTVAMLGYAAEEHSGWGKAGNSRVGFSSQFSLLYDLYCKDVN